MHSGQQATVDVSKQFTHSCQCQPQSKSSAIILSLVGAGVSGKMLRTVVDLARISPVLSMDIGVLDGAMHTASLYSLVFSFGTEATGT